MDDQVNPGVSKSKRPKKNVTSWKKYDLQTKRNSGVGYTTLKNKEIHGKIEPGQVI